MATILDWLRKRFYSRWDLLDAMTPGKWYHGRDLCEETGYHFAGMQDKLEQLRMEGYVEDRRILVARTEDAMLVTVEYRTTTKRKPVGDERVSYV